MKLLLLAKNNGCLDYFYSSLESSNTCYFLGALFEFSEFRLVDSRWIFPL